MHRRVYVLLSAVAILVAMGETSVAGAAGNDPLNAAARAGDWNTVKTLLTKGLRGDQVNVADSDGTRALHWAIRVDEVDIAQLLLRAGADAKSANRLGMTPLYMAATNGNPAMIRLLLDAGADPNQVDAS